jgi:peroxiredoxin
MKRRSQFKLGSVVALALFSVLCIAAEDPPAIQIGSIAPAFTLSDEAGKPHTLADLKGKFVVLEWTNPNCPFVQRHYEQHTMQKLADKYKSSGVVWLAINSSSDSSAKGNTAWATENKLTYPVLDDKSGKVGKAYAAKTTPDMFIIDKEGKVIYEGGIDNDPEGNKGASRVNYVEQALDAAIAGKPVAIPQTKSYGCHVAYAD